MAMIALFAAVQVVFAATGLSGTGAPAYLDYVGGWRSASPRSGRWRPGASPRRRPRRRTMRLLIAAVAVVFTALIAVLTVQDIVTTGLNWLNVLACLIVSCSPPDPRRPAGSDSRR